MGYGSGEGAPDAVKLEFTEQAVGDIQRLREFIAEKNPDAAQRISVQLIGHIQSLVDRPRIGHPLEDLPGVREWVARDYVVHYLVVASTQPHSGIC